MKGKLRNIFNVAKASTKTHAMDIVVIGTAVLASIAAIYGMSAIRENQSTQPQPTPIVEKYKSDSQNAQIVQGSGDLTIVSRVPTRTERGHKN